MLIVQNNARYVHGTPHAHRPEHRRVVQAWNVLSTLPYTCGTSFLMFVSVSVSVSVCLCLPVCVCACVSVCLCVWKWLTSSVICQCFVNSCGNMFTILLQLSIYVCIYVLCIMLVCKALRALREKGRYIIILYTPVSSHGMWIWRRAFSYNYYYCLCYVSSTKLPHPPTDDRLVNASNNGLRSYVTVQRPTAALAGERPPSASGAWHCF